MGAGRDNDPSSALPDRPDGGPARARTLQMSRGGYAKISEGRNRVTAETLRWALRSRATLRDFGYGDVRNLGGFQGWVDCGGRSASVMSLRLRLRDGKAEGSNALGSARDARLDVTW
jgi:hypothetical protein